MKLQEVRDDVCIGHLLKHRRSTFLELFTMIHMLMKHWRSLQIELKYKESKHVGDLWSEWISFGIGDLQVKELLLKVGNIEVMLLTWSYEALSRSPMVHDKDLLKMLRRSLGEQDLGFFLGVKKVLWYGTYSFLELAHCCLSWSEGIAVVVYVQPTPMLMVRSIWNRSRGWLESSSPLVYNLGGCGLLLLG